MALKFLSFMLPTGSPGVGKVLTSDGSGVGTWQTVPAAQAGTFDGGNASTTFSGIAQIDAGGAT